MATMVGLILAGALAAQAADPAAAAAGTDGAKPPPAAGAGQKAAQPKPDKVCVTEAQLGSHFKRRICATPAEWEARRLRDQEAMSRNGGKAPSSCTGVAC
ncbi:MAG: hypothetical protein JNL41_13030 [Phenylobacterium sp.]|uniref:hypothetical protein n=1 Tax=Phenylobacterium sp. TaxID=1871053 RepID=UPI001A3A2C8F|nr:hypothetical protein [Phenylobacterium sp.]MBL8555198.1 hypothetical protein [Phenylobacterium sp.]